nr:ABC transporter B family member 9-like [Ipomoea trifida]
MKIAYKSIILQGLASGVGLDMVIVLFSSYEVTGAFAAGQATDFKMFETINHKPFIDASNSSGIKLEDIKD